MATTVMTPAARTRSVSGENNALRRVAVMVAAKEPVKYAGLQTPPAT